MSYKTSCRSCKINKHLTGSTGEHQLVDAELYCLVCTTSTKSIYHSENEDLAGDCYECSDCHNYILYTDSRGTITKDEIYFSGSIGEENTFLIRSVEENFSCFVKNDNKVYEVNNIIQFSNVNELYGRLNKLVVFS